VPKDDEIPSDEVGAAIRRGRALLQATRDSLPRYVGNKLRCMSCHLDFGTRPDGIPFVGVYARLPQYRARSGRSDLIEGPVNDCFLRSMNGRPLARDGKEMRDIVAYFAFMSRGVAPPGVVPGQGLPKMTPLTGDTIRGMRVYAETCTRCHGPDGGGTLLAPPVWGQGSFNIGAGMARLRTAAGFIRFNMPNDKQAVLDDQQAFDVAAYVLSRPRPDFAGKENDWPNGDPPPDVAYPTKAAAKQHPQHTAGRR